MVTNLSNIKNRFGALLAILHNEGYLDDAIDNMIIKSSFFDCFENNDVDLFMNTGIEDIVMNVFGKNIIVDYNSPLVSEYYWAGQNYIQIMLNNNVPLKRIFILLPLRKMVDLFSKYHEMNPIKLCERYNEIEKSVSLLKVLRADSTYSIRKLAFLTGIKEITLKSYELNNDKLFNASSGNINKISNQFNIPRYIFVKESSFVPYFDFLFKDDEFIDNFTNNICIYLNIENEKAKFVDYHLESKEIIKLLKKYKKIIYIKKPGIIYSTRGQYILSEKEYMSLWKLTIIKIISLHSKELYF